MEDKRVRYGYYQGSHVINTKFLKKNASKMKNEIAITELFFGPSETEFLIYD